MTPTSLQDLQEQYARIHPFAINLCKGLHEYLQTEIQREGIKLACPIEYRVKTRASIAAKIGSKTIQPMKLERLNDLVGLRICLLFPSQLPKLWSLLETSFEVLKRKDIADKLSESEFGYQSVHFQIGLTAKLRELKTFRECGNLNAEIQVRTLAQHLWASASHTLQYKNAHNTPKPFRRTLTRLAALLETVDFELERLHNDRASYLKDLELESDESSLNSDNLEAILRVKLPQGNWIEDHDYSELVDDVAFFGIEDKSSLIEFIDFHSELLPTVDPEAALVEPSPDDPWDEGYIGDYSPGSVLKFMLAYEYPDLYKQFQSKKLQEAFKDFNPEEFLL